MESKRKIKGEGDESKLSKGKERESREDIRLKCSFLSENYEKVRAFIHSCLVGTAGRSY